MSDLTLPRLMEVMRDCAGDGEDVDFDGDIGDTSFNDLGYDSLARLETAARLSRDLGIRLPDEEVTGATTPREFLELVNRCSSTAGTGG